MTQTQSQVHCYIDKDSRSKTRSTHCDQHSCPMRVLYCIVFTCITRIEPNFWMVWTRAHLIVHPMISHPIVPPHSIVDPHAGTTRPSTNDSHTAPDPDPACAHSTNLLYLHSTEVLPPILISLVKSPSLLPRAPSLYPNPHSFEGIPSSSVLLALSLFQSSSLWLCLSQCSSRTPSFWLRP